MKNGDLIHMPGETLVGNAVPSIGIVVDDKVTASGDTRAGRGRIGILWVDGGGRVDYEPKEWLEVISEAVPLEA
tara:strand:+ start:2038 stop:2259 length:222 start_codon:yes stop_codon:yes gene_type:complete